MVSPTPTLAGPQPPRRRQRRRAAGLSGSRPASPEQCSPFGGDREPGRVWGRKAGWCGPSVARAKDSCLGSWTQPTGLVAICLLAGTQGAERGDFLLPASWVDCALRIPPFFPAPLSPARGGTFARAFSCSFHWEGGLVEGSASPGEERGSRRFAFPLLLLLAVGLSSVLVWRLATGGLGFPQSERFECGGVFLWFCSICMLARVILFSLLVFL